MSTTQPDDGRRPGREPSPDGTVDLRDGAGDAASTPTVVPHVVGHHIDVALRMVRDLGLTGRVVTTEVHDKTDRHVVSTHPAAGSPAARGSVVEVVVGIAPAAADYLGHDADDAVRLGEVAGHVVEVVLRDPSRPRSTTEVVVAQHPEPGERSRILLLHVGSPND